MIKINKTTEDDNLGGLENFVFDFDLRTSLKSLVNPARRQ
jgi:hypothetical protein